MPVQPQTCIQGIGYAVPPQVLTNADLEAMVETSDAWIAERTGIKQRHIAEAGTPASQLAAEAAGKALERAGVSAAELDVVILATVTGDMTFPSAACILQERLGAHQAAAFDISAACSGFLYSLELADALMQAKGYQKVLVVAAEILSSMVDWQDRDTCVLFGDGAGAAVLSPAVASSGILSTYIDSDGRYQKLLYNPGGGSLHPVSKVPDQGRLATIHMEGREVFRHAVASMGNALDKALTRAGHRGEDLDLLIPHQANQRIISAIAKRFGMPNKVFSNVQHYGNTSAASVPIALCEAASQGLVPPGSLVGLATFGAGFTSAAAVVRL